MEKKFLLLTKYKKPVFCLLIFLWTLLSYFQTENWLFEMIFSPYILISLFSAVSLFLNEKYSVSLESFSKTGKKVILSSSAIFSLFILIADFTNYLPIGSIETTFLTSVIIYSAYSIISFLGGAVVWAECVMFLSETYKRICTSAKKKKAARERKSIRPFWFFIVPFILFTALYMINFIIEFPGNINPDSLDQIGQIISGKYSDHHPVLHTLLIKVFYEMGYAVFGDINSAIAVYTAFQILVITFTFSCAVETAYLISGSIKAPAAIFAFMFIMPYNLCYSCTIWKDTLFAAMVLLFVVSVLRILKSAGNTYFNYALLIVSTMDFAVLRNNGIFALVPTFICMCLMFRRKHKWMKILVLASLVITMLAKSVIMNALNVRPTESSESLSIPCQQIACVVNEGKFDSEDEELITKLCSIEYINEEYLPYISDPIKGKVNCQYFFEHKSDYLKLWIKLGLKNPTKYIKAWVNQTVGYWNAGYKYWVYYDAVCENDMGLEKIEMCRSAFIDSAASIKEIFVSNSKKDTLRIFLSIGVHFWVLCLLTAGALINKRKEVILISLPILFQVLSLLIATPVFCEFRYIYSMFLTLPLTIAVYFVNDRAAAGDEG